MVISFIAGFDDLRKEYCQMNLTQKRKLLESDDVTGKEAESLLASVRYVYYVRMKIAKGC